VKIFEKNERRTFVPQRPYRAPWVVIWLTAATTAFLAGHIVSTGIENGGGGSALTDGGFRGDSANLQQPSIGPNNMKSFFPSSDNPVADIVASSGKSVVSIDTTIRRTSSADLPDFLFASPGGSPTFREPRKFEAHGSGSGVIIRQDGYVLTNAHVVKGAQDIKVTLSNKREFNGRVVGRDAYSDVALVKIDANNLPVAQMADGKKTRPGDWAIAIGSPLGLNHTVTMGIVSAVGRSLADLNNNVDLIQTDAAINPGNSGGPLLNIHGEVIGINMAIRTDAQNIGFSIPIDIARDAVNAMLAHKPIQRPYLGISMVDFDPRLAASLDLPKNLTGVLVSKVVPQGPAARAGVKEGDMIQKVNSTPVKTGNDVQTIVRSQKVGNTIDMQVFHAGTVRNLRVEIRSLPQNSDVG